MDESWRMHVGKGRASTVALDPEDFSDVFGGPPQTVLLHNFYGNHVSSSSPSFNRRISRPNGVSPPSKLPASFGIPDAEATFYEDVFGSYGDRKSRDRSGPGSNGTSKSKYKSNSSSVLSSEDLSPLRPVVGDDSGLFSFALKLRPINVPCRWNSTADFSTEHQSNLGTPVLPGGRPSTVEDQLMGSLYKNSNFKSPRSGLSRRALSPEALDAESNSNRGNKITAEVEIEVASRSYVISGDQDVRTEEQKTAVASDDEDEISSSYVIEITPGIKDYAGETQGIDEAIAWAKEKFTCDNALIEGKELWSRTKSWKEHAMPELKDKLKTDDHASNACGKNKSSQMMEFEALDRNMKIWTSGKEKDIRLLLSKLHQIMWPESGWEAVPMTSLIERSQVKKAYQKSMLCLHPDRLQQRRTTFLQKYIAHKALTILQDSWTKYIEEGEGRSDHSIVESRR